MTNAIQKTQPQPVTFVNFTSSAQYWDERYRRQGHSGAGSYGRLARFKASVLNRLVQECGIETVIEFGCGDGNQLSLADYADYTGFDVSAVAVAQCRRRFAGDDSKRFMHTDEWRNQQADLTLSLDVIYHLVEEAVFAEYMRRLFSSSRRYVMIYASNDEKYNALLAAHVKHVRHRKFTDWLLVNPPGNWRLKTFIANAYPFDPRDSDNTSFADFYLFEKLG